jgi:hypothetical protein
MNPLFSEIKTLVKNGQELQNIHVDALRDISDPECWLVIFSIGLIKGHTQALKLFQDTRHKTNIHPSNPLQRTNANRSTLILPHLNTSGDAIKPILLKTRSCNDLNKEKKTVKFVEGDTSPTVALKTVEHSSSTIERYATDTPQCQEDNFKTNINKVPGLVKKILNKPEVRQFIQARKITDIGEHTAATRDLIDYFQQSYPDLMALLLVLAAKYNIVETARGLLDVNVDVNAQDIEGNSALLYAVKNNSNQMVILLLRHFANSNLSNKAGETPYIVAINSGKLLITNLLMRHGNHQDNATPGSQLPSYPMVRQQQKHQSLKNTCTDHSQALFPVQNKPARSALINARPSTTGMYSNNSGKSKLNANQSPEINNTSCKIWNR